MLARMKATILAMVVSLGLVACGALASGSGGDAVKSESEVLIGVVTAQGTRLCDGSRDGKWIDLRHEIGFVRALGEVALAEYEGRALVAEGQRVSSYESEVPEHTGECPMPMQMRSDWVEGPSGIRVRRADRPFPAFRVRSVRPFDGVAARLVGDVVTISVRNTLGRALEDVVVTLHYEGCFGKPGTRQQTAVLGALAPGQAGEVSLPGWHHDEDGPRGRSDYRGWSLRLGTSTAGVTFDLDLHLHRLGVEIDCERGD